MHSYASCWLVVRSQVTLVHVELITANRVAGLVRYENSQGTHLRYVCGLNVVWSVTFLSRFVYTQIMQQTEPN